MLLGLASTALDQRFAAQKDSMWCWAASLQMIFWHYGIDLRQEDLVQRLFGVTPYGTLPNKPADFMHITKCLNHRGTDRRGRRYTVQSMLMPGAPTAAQLAEEMSAQRPVLLSYQSRPRMNHAVVISAMELVNQPGGLLWKRIIVRDPAPQARNRNVKGRREYRPSTLLNKAAAYWLIRVKIHA